MQVQCGDNDISFFKIGLLLENSRKQLNPIVDVFPTGLGGVQRGHVDDRCSPSVGPQSGRVPATQSACAAPHAGAGRERVRGAARAAATAAQESVARRQRARGRGQRAGHRRGEQCAW